MFAFDQKLFLILFSTSPEITNLILKRLTRANDPPLLNELTFSFFSAPNSAEILLSWLLTLFCVHEQEVTSVCEDTCDEDFCN